MHGMHAVILTSKAWENGEYAGKQMTGLASDV